MFFRQSIVLRFIKSATALPLLALISCENTSTLPSLNHEISETDMLVCQSLNFESDAFQLSDSNDSQFNVFESLFLDSNAYQLPGNPTKENLSAYFKDLRKGYFQKDEGIDYSFVRKEYHTFTHAMDVMITTHALLNSGGAVYLNTGERAALVLAALGHDALHTGVNNSFLIQTNHAYFQDTGGNSLQETRSANYVLQLLDKHRILVTSEEMNDTQRNEIHNARNIIEQSILWTDIKRHKEQIEAVELAKKKILNLLNQKRLIQVNEGIVGAGKLDMRQGLNLSAFIDSETKMLIASFILHCADISNPGKDWVKCERWAVLVMNEFFSQGDLQKQLGLKPSMNCDRNTVSVPSCQVGFGKFVIRDLYVLLEEILHDGGGYLLDNFNSNQEKWKALHKSCEKTGSPYTMNFLPPSKEGGWMGQLRSYEK
ncbi:MAG: 3',5'-cyclic nucleotide phosphodiesterase [Opitutales bacterium]|nr:3',5'-cyclic nucleotide phosphodiesterase [Opitutales bacterium]MDG1325557.1 3',5'-cyclic nucleotide phosphodiesterase [Opitutales bacterium]